MTQIFSMRLKYILFSMILIACNNSHSDEMAEQKTNVADPVKQEISDTVFKKKLIIILARGLEPKSQNINIQDYIKDGKSFIPVFTSIDKFNRSTSGQVNNPITEIDGILLLSLLRGNETLKINPGLADETIWQAAELIRRYSAEIDSLNKKIKSSIVL